MRLLVGEKQKAQIYKCEDDGTWKKVNAKKNGSYMIVEMQGERSIYCIVCKESIKQVVCLIGGIALMIGAIIIFIKKKKLYKKNRNKMAQQQSM